MNFLFTESPPLQTDSFSSIRKLEVKIVKNEVADTGIGIAPEDQSYIFERHKQLDKQNAPQKGMRIGLAIVKKILELHQTTIVVTSAPGKGTTFKFVLPVVRKLAV